MTWTSRPRDEVFRALCRTAMATRAAAHETPPMIVSVDTMLPISKHRDGMLKLGRRRLEALCESEDWTNEDWLHLGALAACAFLVAFAFVVILLS